MSTWVQVAQITLTKDWQFTPVTAGQFFRVRHVQGRRVFSGWVVQADISNPASPTLAEARALFCKEQSDLYEFPIPVAFGARAIGVKRLDDSLVPWVVAVDVLSFDVGENPNVYQEFSGAAAALMNLLQDRGLAEIVEAIAAHEAAANPHPEYVSEGDLATALVDLVTDAQLTAALATKADVADVAIIGAALATKADLAALVDLVTDAQLTAALATKADAAALADQHIVLTTTTSGNTLTEMTTPQRVLIQPNSTAGYEIWLTGQNMAAGATEYIYWLGSGALKRGASAASTALFSATGTRRSSGGSGSSWTPTISADTINGGLKIQVKGDPGKTVKWVARVQLTEVG
jgi:hypothetical protein